MSREPFNISINTSESARNSRRTRTAASCRRASWRPAAVTSGTSFFTSFRASCWKGNLKRPRLLDRKMPNRKCSWNLSLRFARKRRGELRQAVFEANSRAPRSTGCVERDLSFFCLRKISWRRRKIASPEKRAPSKKRETRHL